VDVRAPIVQRKSKPRPWLSCGHGLSLPDNPVDNNHCYTVAALTVIAAHARHCAAERKPLIGRSNGQ
jgi:hypothetical protein